MITGVGSVAVLVLDAKKSAGWHHDKLGFEIVGAEGHSVFVRPGGSQTLMIHLCGKCNDWGNDKPGGRTGIWLQCGPVRMQRHEGTGQLIPSSDSAMVEKTYLELKGNGVEFSEELTAPVGVSTQS